MSARLHPTAVLLAVSLVAAACGQPAPPTAADRSIPPPPPPAPLIVLLRRPGADSTAVVGLPVRLESQVLAERPVARLELWVDGSLVEGRDEVGTEAGAEWSWTPSADGIHAVVLRAGDVDGRIMQSAPTWVRVTGPVEAAAGGAGEPPTAARGAGGLPSGWAASAVLPSAPSAPAVTVDEGACTAEVAVPAAAGAAGIAVYAATFGGGGFEAAGLLPASGGTLSLPLGASPIVVTAGVYDAVSEVPSAPAIVYPPNPCATGSWTGDLAFSGGVLTAPDVEQAYLYVSGDGTGWDRVPAGDQNFVDRGAGGTFDFSSALPAVQAGGSLFVEAWGRVNGGLRALGRGTYTSPGSAGAADLGSPFLLLPKAGLDWVAGKKLDSVTLKYCTGGPDCDILLRSGDLCGEHVLGDKPLNTKDDAEWKGLFIGECTPVSPAKTFRWTPTIVGGVTHGLVQISTLPPPSGTALSFPGLVHTKPVAQVGGDFPVDLAEVLYPTLTVSSGSLTYGQVVALSPAGGAAGAAGGGSSPSVVSSGILLASPFASPATAPESASPPGATSSTLTTPGLPFAVASPSVLYVRVVPMSGEQPVDDATNPVTFTIVPVTPTWYEVYKPKILGGVTMTVTSVLPPGLPNPKYGRCVRVTGNPHGSENPALVPLMEPLYDAFEPAGVGKTLCAVYSPPDDDWWDVISDAVDFVTDVWDAFSDFYGSLQSAVVNGVVSLTGCKPADICKTVVGGLINVGLAAVGVPPTIPKWEDVVAGAKGDLKAFVMTAMASQGVDCGVAKIACEELAGEILDATLDEIEEHVSAAAVSAASSGDYYLYLNPDISVVPEPVSAVQPGVWKVTFTRVALDDPTDEVVEAKSCTVWGSVQGHYPSHTWSDDAPPHQNKSVKHTNEPVDGLVMTGPALEVELASLPVGGSRSVTVLAPTMNEWYPPGLEDGYLQGVYEYPHTWVFFQKGATLDLDLNTDCSASWGTTVAMDGTPTTPQEYPYP